MPAPTQARRWRQGLQTGESFGEILAHAGPAHSRPRHAGSLTVWVLNDIWGEAVDATRPPISLEMIRKTQEVTSPQRQETGVPGAHGDGSARPAPCHAPVRPGPEHLVTRPEGRPRDSETQHLRKPRTAPGADCFLRWPKSAFSNLRVALFYFFFLVVNICKSLKMHKDYKKIT